VRVPLRPRELAALIAAGVFAVAASGTHVVRSGESLDSIARSHGTSVRALVEANGISNPNLILAGKQLVIPGSGGGGGGARPSSVHVVRSGDTLAGIAARYGTTASAIASANGISNPNLIVIGRSLQISGPAGGSGGTSARTSSGSSTAGGTGSPTAAR